MKKKTGFTLMALLLAAAFLFCAGNAAADLRVNVMPSGFASKVNSWDSEPYTWPGNALELWGNVAYDGSGTLTYTWNFGAGEGTTAGTVTNRNNIAATHTYAGTGSYVATLTVTDGTETDTDTVFIDVVPQSLEVLTNLAIQRGLKYLYMVKRDRGVLNGHQLYTWPHYEYIAGTALSVMAFQNHGHLEKNSPDQDIYAETVMGGINMIFHRLIISSATMDNTNYTDSDINGNGIKTYCYSYNMYHVGITAMAIAGTVTPNETIRDVTNLHGNNYYHGKTYKELLEDLVDYIAYAQKEGTTGYAGGWRYYPNYSSSDNSVSQWPALGLGEAERAPWNINAPAWVKTRLPIWINTSQVNNPSDYRHGGFGYTSAYNWTNVAKTGAGIVEMVYAGGGGNLTNAVNYIAANWGTTSYDYGNIGDHYAMYGVKKGMEYADLSTVGGHDWQQEYNQWYVNNKVNNGTNGYSWNGSVRINAGHLATALGLLVMAPLEVEKPIAVAGGDQEVTEGNPVTFDGSGSFHTAPASYGIILYEWDFDYDGINFDVDATGAVATNAGGYTITNGTDTQDFTVALRVTDNQSPAKSDTDTLVVTVTNGNVAPVADPGGPYLGAVGENITLDGSGSYDDNEEFGLNPIYNTAKAKWDEIESYKWDLDGDGLYGDEDSPADPEGVNPAVNFGAFMGTKTVKLKVTDSFGKNATQSVQATTVAVSDLYPIDYELVSKTYNRRTRMWTVTWKVYIRNDGNGAATEVSAYWTPASVPAGVTTTDAAVAWSGSIDPGETQLSDDGFSYTYSRSSSGPDLTQITWDIEFTDNLGVRHVIRNVPQ